MDRDLPTFNLQDRGCEFYMKDISPQDCRWSDGELDPKLVPPLVRLRGEGGTMTSGHFAYSRAASRSIANHFQMRMSGNGSRFLCIATIDFSVGLRIQVSPQTGRYVEELKCCICLTDRIATSADVVCTAQAQAQI